MNMKTGYTAVVGIGTPPTECTYHLSKVVHKVVCNDGLDTLLIDTGSANTWIGSTREYVKTRTSVDTGDSISISYGSGSVIGEECKYTIYYSI